MVRLVLQLTRNLKNPKSLYLSSLPHSQSLSLIICSFFSLSKRKADRARKKMILLCVMYIGTAYYTSIGQYTCTRVYLFKHTYIYMYILCIRRLVLGLLSYRKFNFTRRTSVNVYWKRIHTHTHTHIYILYVCV